MHSVDLLEETIQLARQLGFEIRQEWLDGSAAGICRIGDRRVLFLDLSLPANEQLEQVVNALRESKWCSEERVDIRNVAISNALRRLLYDTKSPSAS